MSVENIAALVISIIAAIGSAIPIIIQVLKHRNENKILDADAKLKKQEADTKRTESDRLFVETAKGLIEPLRQQIKELKEENVRKDIALSELKEQFSALMKRVDELENLNQVKDETIEKLSHQVRSFGEVPIHEREIKKIDRFEEPKNGNGKENVG